MDKWEYQNKLCYLTMLLENRLSRGLPVYAYLKGQWISKQNCQAGTSPKKQTNKFVFLSWQLENTWNLKSKFKFLTNLFIRFLGEVTAWQSCFEIYWPLAGVAHKVIVVNREIQKQLHNDFGPKRPPVAAMQTWPEKIVLQLLSSVEELRSSKTKHSYLNKIAFNLFLPPFLLHIFLRRNFYVQMIHK